jgi:hypothetical protein
MPQAKAGYIDAGPLAGTVIRVPGRSAPKPRRFEQRQGIVGRLAQSPRQTRTADPCSKIVG